MIPLAETAHLIVALMAIGTGATIWLTDRSDVPNRALSLALVAIGASQTIDRTGGAHVLWTVFLECCEAVGFLAGMELGRRIGRTARGRRGTAANVLFRVAQLLVIVTWGLSLGYIAIAPEQAMSDTDGLIKTSGLEFAIFAPVLGTALLLASIAIVLLLTARIDSADSVRLRTLYLATPALVGSLIVTRALEPYFVATGLLLLSWASTRHLTILGKRGAFMGQFLSPQVAAEVRRHGLDHLLERRRMTLSVVVVDLRGFTAYAHDHDSATVFALLEAFYRAVGDAARAHGGTVKDHAGDGVLVLVGAPFALDDHAQRALSLAGELVTGVRAALHTAGAADCVGVGVGVATGSATVGAIAGAGRLEYAAVGNPLVLASRLCNRAADREILADTRTRDEAGTVTGFTIADAPAEPLKGFDAPVPVCALRLQSAMGSGETTQPQSAESAPAADC